MATKTAEQKKVEKLLKVLSDAKVEVTGTETVDELQAKVDALKPAKVEKNSTTFVFRNGGTRTFSQSVHGDSWEESADEFAETNKATIATRDGEAL